MKVSSTSVRMVLIRMMFTMTVCIMILSRSMAAGTKRGLKQAAGPVEFNFGDTPAAAPDPEPGAGANATAFPLKKSMIEIDPNCRGIQIDYQLIGLTEITPTIGRYNETQPFRFDAFLYLTNLGHNTLKSWQITIGWHNEEILVGMEKAVLRVNSKLPTPVDSDSIIMGYPDTDLKNSIDTAGNWTFIQRQMRIYGTCFGTPNFGDALPKNLSLHNEGWKYDRKSKNITDNSMKMRVCYQENAGANATTALATTNLPAQSISNSSSDVVIVYDIINSLFNQYDAKVTIFNNMKYGRVDNWTLSWEWTGGEIIASMQGAEATQVGDCLHVPAAIYYKNLQNQVHTCEPEPQIVDLMLNRATPASQGVKACCKNGTILPAVLDPSQSYSQFVMTVFKIPPMIGEDTMVPPVNFRINKDEYLCTPPVRTLPTVIPIDGSRRVNYAVQSFEVQCNKTSKKPPSCCVSFSAFWNDTAAPCKACACGCTYANTIPGTCNVTGQSTPLPFEALVLPAVDRTAAIDKYEAIHRRRLLPANTLPACGDNCGVSLNWHIKGNSHDGWAARLTVFNWEPQNKADWYVAIQNPYFVALNWAWSVNFTKDVNHTDWMLFTGVDKFNKWLLPLNGSFSPAVPGTIQSVMAFYKNSTTPPIDFRKGQGFPTEVIFNGQTCAMPDYIPTGGVARSHLRSLAWGLLTLAAVTCHLVIFL
eukprot:TRINITY_DN180_c0_g1_i1.p1 TRINITY_DN180_c0_g1~~TRINITY_DN180_c0_g1_i1.p1  ORF type:complete len:702 (+),score=89.78 TRINITY_DN180_c0_g1_i1:352-2457(+)